MVELRWPHRRGLRRLLLVSLVCGSVPTVAHPQVPAPATPSSSAATPRFVTDVLVTPERGAEQRPRLLVASAVLERKEIEQLPALSVAELLDALPGFTVVSPFASGLPATVSARGFFGGGEADYVKLLIDGMPVGDPESGRSDWRGVPAFAIERVEALRGPASPVYGDAALGGVIQLFTSRRRDAGGRVEVGGGTFASSNAGVELGAPVAGGTLVGLASYARSDGSRPFADRDERFGSVAFTHHHAARQWSARGWVSRTRFGEPGARAADQRGMVDASDPLYRFDRDVNRRVHGAVQVASTAGKLHWRVLGYLSDRSGDRVRTLLLLPGVSDRAARDVDSTRAGVVVENSLETTVAGRAGSLRFGADASAASIDTTYHAVTTAGERGDATSTFAGNRYETAAYATHALDVTSRIRLHAGVRWDLIADRRRNAESITHRAWSPRLGASYGTGGAAPVVLFAQVSRAFKAATLDQLFDPRPFPDFRGGTFQISNARLEPQRAVSVEAGVRRSTRRARWEIVVYRMRLRDEIDFDPATFGYGNIGRSTHQGVESEISVAPVSPLRVAVYYALADVVPDGPGARQLKNIPRHTLRPSITLTWPRMSLHLTHTRMGQVYADDANAFPLRGRRTVDLRAAGTISRRLRVHVDAINVFDRGYEEAGYTLQDFRDGVVPYYYPGSGAAVRAGLEVRFGGQ